MSRTKASSRSWFQRYAGALSVGGFGSIFAIVGLLMLLVGVPSTLEHARRVRDLPALTPGNLGGFAHGTSVLLEGKIAVGASTPIRDFVAGTRQEFRGWKEDGGKRKEQWDTIEVVRPLLPILTESGVVRVINSDYEMRDEPHAWQSSNALIYSLVGERTQRVSGFKRGDVVSAEGVIERGNEAVGLRASAVVGRDRAGYVASLESGAATLRLIGRIFAGVGAVLAVVALIVLARSRTAAG